MSRGFKGAAEVGWDQDRVSPWATGTLNVCFLLQKKTLLSNWPI